MPKLVTESTPDLKIPQARVLCVLLPDGDEPPEGTIPRAILAAEAGFVPTSGTMSKVLRGIQNPDSSTGKKHDGLLQMRLIELVQLDVDGATVDTYRITRAGIRAIRSWLRHNTLPEKKSDESCINDRYKS